MIASIKSARVTDTMTAQQPTKRKGAKVRPMGTNKNEIQPIGNDGFFIAHFMENNIKGENKKWRMK